MPGDTILEDPPLLTPRQTEVVRLAVLGLTSKETARRLGISKNTVDEHLSEARRRVGAPTKSCLIGWAVASGIVRYEANT
ncbi:MAG: helix-turn-helix transcriptional regulator [Actinocatenispora sp.]